MSAPGSDDIGHRSRLTKTCEDYILGGLRKEEGELITDYGG